MFLKTVDFGAKVSTNFSEEKYPIFFSEIDCSQEQQAENVLIKVFDLFTVSIKQTSN